jgi:hypothetical protein
VSENNEEQTTLVDKQKEKQVKNTAEKMVEKTLASIKIPVGSKTPEQYIDDMRSNNLALAQAREDYLRELALMQWHTFPINTADVNDPYAEPVYGKSARLQFHDVSIHQWDYFQKLKVDAEDLNRISFTPLQSFAQTKTPVPPNFDKLRRERLNKELEQYIYGFWIFYRGTREQFNQGDYTFIRDRVDAAEYRVNNSLPFSTPNSTTSSTLSTPMSDSVR